jgi:hypothetical protein
VSELQTVAGIQSYDRFSLIKVNSMTDIPSNATLSPPY